MKRVEKSTKDRLRRIDAATGYAGFVGLRTVEDAKLFKLGWIEPKQDRPNCFRISRKGRAALKRYAGWTSAYAGSRTVSSSRIMP